MPIDDELRRRVDKHDQDLYQGNGKPALTIRMALAERDIENMNKAAEEIKADSKKIKFMVIAALLAIVGDIIVKLVAR